MVYSLEFYEEYLEKVKGFSKINWVRNYLDLKRKPNFWTILEYGQINNSRQKSSHEIRYSKMMRWLFDANENHNLGNVFAYKLFKKIENKTGNELDLKKKTSYELDLEKNSLIKSTSESLADIDIFYSDLNQDVCLAIELKQFATEHESTGYDSQLDKYKDAVEKFITKKGRNISPYFVYLTPLEEKPTNDNWCAVGYKHMLEIIEEVNEEYLSKSTDFYKSDIKKIIGDFKDDLQRSIDILDKDTSYIGDNFSEEELEFTVLLVKEIVGETESEHIDKLKRIDLDSNVDTVEMIFLINDYIYNQDHTPNEGVRLLIRKIYQYLSVNPNVDLNLQRKYEKEERIARIKPEIIEKYKLKVSKIELTGGKGQGIHLLNEEGSRSIYFSGDSKGEFPNTRLQLLNYSKRTKDGRKPVIQISEKIRRGLFTADYNLVEDDKIHLNKNKDKVEIKSLDELIENYLLEAVKELDASLS